MSDQYRVIAKDPVNGRVREHFAGTADDAHEYVVNNFPRPHVEPGSTPDRLRGDVQVVTPEGTRHEYHGPQVGWVDIDDNDEVVNDVDEVSPEEVE